MQYLTIRKQTPFYRFIFVFLVKDTNFLSIFFKYNRVLENERNAPLERMILSQNVVDNICSSMVGKPKREKMFDLSEVCLFCCSLLITMERSTVYQERR